MLCAAARSVVRIRGGATRGGRSIMATSTPAVKLVSVQEALKLMSAGTPYLDVRSKAEFDKSHVVGALHASLMEPNAAGALEKKPTATFLNDVSAVVSDKTKNLLVACAAGKRSAMAAAELSQAGYTNLLDVDGGFQAWTAAGLPVSS